MVYTQQELVRALVLLANGRLIDPAKWWQLPKPPPKTKVRPPNKIGGKSDKLSRLLRNKKQR